MSKEAIEINAKMKARAKGYDDKVRESVPSTLSTGFFGYKIKKEGLFAVLGFDSEKAYYEARHIGRSTWYVYVGLAESFEKLPEKDFLKFNVDCAKLLAKLPEEKRYREDLIKKAQEMTEPEFQKIIKRFKAQEDGVEEGEVIVTFKLRMPDSRREFILDCLKEFIDEHKLDDDDYSRALELAMAELRTGDKVRTKVVGDLPRLIAANGLLNGKAGNRSQDEVMKEVHAALGEHIRGVAQAAGYKLQ